MPTIEIISLKAEKLDLNQDEFDIAIIEENKLKSHRGLFNKFLKKNKGVIVHIGNPEFKDDKEGGFFAGQIIDWDFGSRILILPNFSNEETGANQSSRYKFLTDFKIEIQKIISIAIDKSPIREALFLTDYQFGSENSNTLKIRLKDFWELHDNKGLEWNTMYKFKSKK